MNITDNFTLEELCSSDTAVSKGIDNSPCIAERENLIKLATTILQPARDYIGKPLRITSGFRGEKLNEAVGGSRTSQHLYGEAADIVVRTHDGIDKRAMKSLFGYLAEHARFGQLIWEYGGRWIHVSLPSNRLSNGNGQILTIFTSNGHKRTESINKTWRSYIGY